MEITIIKLYDAVSNLLKFVRQDLLNNIATPYNSWLYLEFKDNTLGDTNFYTQLKSLIEKKEDDQRQLVVRLMFDRDRANLPTFHIHYPSENAKSGDNTLGMGFESPTLLADEDFNIYSRSFIGEYEIIVTGGSSVEVVMLYEFIDAMLIAGADTLSHLFDIYSFTGKQLGANQELIPFLTFYRSIGMTIQAKKKVRSFVDRAYGTSIEFNETTYLDTGQQPAEVVVSVSITSDEATTITDTVTVTAVPVNGGTSPLFEWYVGGVLQTQNTGPTLLITHYYSLVPLEVYCKCYSSILYLLPNPAISETIFVTAIYVPTLIYIK